MTDRYKNKYRIASIRAQWWDYHRAGAYFITICTRDRIHYFGEIVDGTMHLSEIGKIVEHEWLRTFELRTDMHLIMGAYVVMPDHFHAIIGIGENEYNTPRDTPRETLCRDAMPGVSTGTGRKPDKPEKPDNGPKPANRFGPQSKNLASVIRGFKSSVTVAARKIDPNFAWQSRYYDHIIRNRQSFEKISQYIINNPLNWKNDDYFKP